MGHGFLAGLAILALPLVLLWSVLYLFKLAFEQSIAGYAAAIAYVLLVAILILTVIQLWVGKRMVYYAS